PATAAPVFSQADLSAAVTAALEQAEKARQAKKAAKRAKAAEAAPAAPAAVAETDEARIARLVEEKLVAERQAITAAGGGPSRKGLVTEHSALKPADAVSALPVDDQGNAIPMERWNEGQRRAVGVAL